MLEARDIVRSYTRVGSHRLPLRLVYRRPNNLNMNENITVYRKQKNSNDIPGQGLLLMVFLLDGLWMYVILVSGEKFYRS